MQVGIEVKDGHPYLETPFSFLKLQGLQDRIHLFQRKKKGIIDAKSRTRNSEENIKS